MTLKRTMVFLDPEDHRALFERALDESRRHGRRVTMAEMVRQAVKEFLRGKGRQPNLKAAEYTGMRLKTIREKRGWTQTELAEKIGVSRATIFYLETGGLQPSADLLHRLAKALKVKVGELLK